MDASDHGPLQIRRTDALPEVGVRFIIQLPGTPEARRYPVGCSSLEAAAALRTLARAYDRRDPPGKHRGRGGGQAW